MLTNPLIPEPGMSDPHALVVEDTVYLFTGHDVGTGVPDWVMPDWRIYRSDDLQHWEHVGTIDPKDCYMGAGNTNCWAGDIAERNGRFYWYFSNHTESTGVMVADRPEGPYVDALGEPLLDSFDPTIFVDDDGTPYIINGENHSAQGTYRIAKLKENMIELAEEPRPIALDPWGAFPRTDKNSLHKHRGIYYLSCSAYYATSENVYGPYRYRGKVGTGWGLSQRTGSYDAFAHGDFFLFRDNWYHVWTKYIDRSVDRMRNCFLAPLHYLEDGSMHTDTRNLPQEYADENTST